MLLKHVYDTPGVNEILYEMLRERSEEDDRHVNISHLELPDWDSHCKFVNGKPYPLWYLIEVGGKLVGQIYATNRNEIGIVILKAHRFKGYGHRAVDIFINAHEPLHAIPAHRPGRFVANINPHNGASIALFTDLGFRLIQCTYQL